MLSPDFSATTSRCEASPSAEPRTDTEIIQEVIGLAQNYGIIEDILNVRYPSNHQQLFPDSGYVNSNSWAHTIMDLANLNVPHENGDNWNGGDALHENRLDPGYCIPGVNINDLDAHNIDTDGDGVLDNLDDDDDNDGVIDADDSDRRDDRIQ